MIQSCYHESDFLLTTKAAYEKLQTKFQEISAELYKNASASGAEGAEHHHESSAESKKEGDVVDAEFEVVDDDNKKDDHKKKK